jgi:flavin reductase (DIM6/NTAB) family NADH-FMN oxidoreductase RutF
LEATIEPTSTEFRRVLGHVPTGVAAITAMSSDGTPLGIAIGSFTSVSLDPPLVGFLPAKTSDSWPKISVVSRFMANVLCTHQRAVCEAMSRKTGKFDDVEWVVGRRGNPMINGCVAWIDCDVHSVTEAGDHFFVLGRVRALEIGECTEPLVFYKSGYGTYLAHE